MARRSYGPRDVASMTCAVCGSKPGEPCRNYKGVNCEPHAMRAPNGDEAAGEKKPPRQRERKLIQRDLFATDL